MNLDPNRNLADIASYMKRCAIALEKIASAVESESTTEVDTEAVSENVLKLIASKMERTSTVRGVK